MRKIFSVVAISVLLTTMSGLSPASAANETEKDVKVLPSSIGINYLDKMLSQQEKDFESKNPLKNNNITKLSESDETVLYYQAMTQVEGQPLKDFRYDISNVKVYKNSLNQVFIEGYIERYFLYEGMPVETGFGDDIKLQINGNSSKNIYSLELPDTDDVKVIGLTSDKSGQITQSQFLKNFRAEKDKAAAQNTTDLADKNKSAAQNTADLADKYKAAAQNTTDLNVQSLETKQSESVVSLAATYTYDKFLAADYARTYALNPNTYYPYFASAGDCTNFVSQALNHGNIWQQGDWFMRLETTGLWNYTYAWINAGTFRNYIREPGGIIMSTESDTFANAYTGDVYHYDTRNSIGLPSPDGVMEHTAIVTGFYGTQILVSYHTTNRLNVLREYYTSVEGGNRYLSHIWRDANNKY
jgi:hypothetical protein